MDKRHNKVISGDCESLNIVYSLGSCGVSLTDIKLSCDPDNPANCRDCPCSQCVLWPKCCFGRIKARRAKRSRRNGAN